MQSALKPDLSASKSQKNIIINAFIVVRYVLGFLRFADDFKIIWRLSTIYRQKKTIKWHY
jgi:hypothetical protein